MRFLISAALAASVLFVTLPASATTYNFVGQPYGNNPFGTDLDPTIFGTQMTGSVTFNQDTSNFTGLIYVSSGLVTDLNLTSGTVTATLPYFDIFANPASPFFSPLVYPGNPNAGFLPDYFELVDGSIQTWMLHGVSSSFEIVATSYLLYSFGNQPISLGSGNESVQSDYPASGTIYAYNSLGLGVWSVTPTDAVPEPSTWAMLLIGFAGIGFGSYKRKHLRYGKFAT